MRNTSGDLTHPPPRRAATAGEAEPLAPLPRVQARQPVRGAATLHDVAALVHRCQRTRDVCGCGWHHLLAVRRRFSSQSAMLAAL